MNKLRILAIDQGEHLGGAERFFAELLTRLSTEYEIHLITTANSSYQALYKDSAAIIYECELPPLKPINFRSVRSLFRCRKNIHAQIKKIKPDLILSNTVRSHIIISPVAKKINIPLLWMAHDLTFPKTLLKWFGRYPQGIICCSDFVKEFYSSGVHLEKTFLETIYPFGIYRKRLEEMRSAPHKKIIGMVGKFITWKGQLEFIKAASRIHKDHPEYQFVIVGDEYKGNAESKQYHQRCLSVIDLLHLSPCFKIKSNIPDLYDELSTWMIQIHCSIASEPLGRVILEGMAAGNAMVVSNLGGPKEIVQDKITGLLVEPNEEGIRSAIEELLLNPTLMNSLQNNARSFIEEKFQWMKALESFQEILSNTAKRRS